jgi:hypothetical protein
VYRCTTFRVKKANTLFFIMTSVRQEGELEQLLRPDGRKGTLVPKSDYARLRLFILNFLDADQGRTLNDILEKAQVEFDQSSFFREVSWLVFQVKLDLEARGFVRSYVPDYNRRMNFLKITRLGQKFLRQEKVIENL